MRLAPHDFTEREPPVAGGRANGVRAEFQDATGGILLDPSNPDHAEYLRNGSGVAGAAVTERSALSVAAAWRCVHIIAGIPANMPFDLMERVSENERRPAVGHPTRALIATRPNHWQTPQEFKRMLTAHIALRGNGYAIKVPGFRGTQALWPIHPDRMRPVQAPDMSLVYQYTSPAGATRILPQGEVLHVRGLSLDGVVGLGALAFARAVLSSAMQGQKAVNKVWEQGAVAGGALEHPNQLSDEAYDRLKASLSERNSGVENTGKWIILEEGMKASNVFLSAADMQFLESRQFDQRQIAMFFGVPPHMIGDTEKSTSWGTGIEQQTTGFVTYTEEDYLTAWEQSVARDLLSLAAAERFYARFNRAALVRGDIKTRWEAYTRALQWGVMSPDEIRALEDLNPRLGGDVFYSPPNQAGGDPGAPTPSETPNDPSAP